MTTSFSELQQLETLAERFQKYSKIARVEIPARVKHGKLDFPLYTFSIGSQKPEAPVFGVSGGVHGLERIGSHLAIAFLNNFLQRLEWDETFQWQLERMRFSFIPLVNPVGMYLTRRSNGNHVDIMRNSPIVAEHSSWMIGGQRISPHIPWYMGKEPGKMEVESQTLVDFFKREVFDSSASVLFDFHSGFGYVDQLWFPWAKSKTPFPHLAEVYRLKRLMDLVMPNHIYIFEPQAKNYTTHGDLWDHLYIEHQKKIQGTPQAKNVLMPITLEMGSWIWIKKNPWQFFSLLGPFNPIKPHRHRRTMRRHLPMLDFFTRVIISHGSWTDLSNTEREEAHAAAIKLWYQNRLPFKRPAEITE